MDELQLISGYDEDELNCETDDGDDEDDNMRKPINNPLGNIGQFCIQRVKR